MGQWKTANIGGKVCGVDLIIGGSTYMRVIR